MKAIRYTRKDVNRIDLGTKLIYKYPTPTKLLDVGLMVVNGRHPEGSAFILEHDCSFVMYVTKGNGKVFVGDETFLLEPEDVVFVPSGKRFAVEGKVEYVTVGMPAFYPEQSEEILG